MTKVLGHSPARRKFQVIELRLMRAHDMFEMPQTDLFSEYRNFLTGVDFCLSELRGRRSWRPGPAPLCRLARSRRGPGWVRLSPYGRPSRRCST